MCGISGAFAASEPSRIDVMGTVRAMTAAMDHRGPDDEGFFLDGRVGLGARRLAIIDLNGGKQPLTNEDGSCVVVLNGEIYNFKDLRGDLMGLGHRFRTRSDTEVVVHAYEQWGRACVHRLRGMFAFAVYDCRARLLFLARDRLGIKPLYYHDRDGVFLFASEVRALLAGRLVPRRLDPIGLWEYLGYQSVPAPRTLIQGVQMLEPGHWLAVDAGGVVTGGRYWDLLEMASPEARAASAEEARVKVGTLLRESVALHLVSDVPVATFLSGGIDSSTVVGLVREAGQRPRTFSVVFEEGAYDEARYARQVAERFDADHTEVLLKERDVLEHLPEALGAMDHPSGDGVNTYVVSRAVHQAGVKVALSGLGGDELFSGYPSTALGRAAGWRRLWGRIPERVRTLAGRTTRALGGSSVFVGKAAALAESDGTIATMLPVLREVLSKPQRRALLEDSWRHAADGCPDPCVDLLREAFARAPDAGELSRISYAEARTYTHDVLLRDTDQMSMAHGLEVRVPLLDHVLAEYVVGLPDARKWPNGIPKRLLVESLRGLVPHEIVHRPKQGFVLPFDRWMRGALRPFCEKRLAPKRLGGRGIIRQRALQGLWQAFLSGRRSVSWSRVWVLVALDEWLERNGIEA
jgi:asparagine synthase (glutamine-hydrolysing)